MKRADLGRRGDRDWHRSAQPAAPPSATAPWCPGSGSRPRTCWRSRQGRAHCRDARWRLRPASLEDRSRRQPPVNPGRRDTGRQSVSAKASWSRVRAIRARRLPLRCWRTWCPISWRRTSKSTNESPGCAPGQSTTVVPAPCPSSRWPRPLSAMASSAAIVPSQRQGGLGTSKSAIRPGYAKAAEARGRLLRPGRAITKLHRAQSVKRFGPKAAEESARLPRGSSRITKARARRHLDNDRGSAVAGAVILTQPAATAPLWSLSSPAETAAQAQVARAARIPGRGEAAAGPDRAGIGMPATRQLVGSRRLMHGHGND